MVRLSVYIITFNEEARLPKTLEAVRPIADEIVIVDSGSTDRTEQIAADYGARFIRHPWESVGHQVAFAEQQCRYRHVLRLDADEVLSGGLAGEIARIKAHWRADGYRLRIGEMFPGYTHPIRWVKHYRLIRLYDREAFAMSGQTGFDDVLPLKAAPKVVLLRGFICHYSYLSLSQMTEKRNRATDGQRDRAVLEGKRYSPWRMVGCMSLNFIKYFILYRYFLYGFWGFIHSVEIAHMRFLKFAKFFEKNELESHPYPGRKAQ